MSRATKFLTSKGILNEERRHGSAFYINREIDRYKQEGGKLGPMLKIGDKVKIIKAEDIMDFYRKEPNTGMSKSQEKKWKIDLEEYLPIYKELEGKVGRVVEALGPHKDYTGMIVNSVYIKYPGRNQLEMFSSNLLIKVEK
jgi:hypothetical protein